MANLFKPKVTPAAPMPDEQDPAVRASRRRVYQQAAQGSGRASTLLSDSYDRDRLGGS